ncbi:hypothetical protein [Lysinibacillus sp. G4S2]|uniref:hypothetical protein n=1 Tax=Lysinibacillus sp. G4S2 TaxID=3055859 RepID=UPI0025A08D15|nr:hypothetical protein [Lysinibacillus sp. G4S2]MDM5250558.1 hypothetical protein [Lysinibacillus sp. G4S2]
MKRLIGRPLEALLCAKAKRQQQSAQSERKSTTRFGEAPVLFYYIHFFPVFIDEKTNPYY